MDKALRWGPFAFFFSAAFLLSLRKSSLPLVFSRYSIVYFAVIAGMGGFAALSFLIALRTRRGREVVSRIFLIAVSVFMSFGFSEILFRNFLLESKVPETDIEFEEIIAADWPRRIEPAKRPGVFRILGLCDSFGRASKYRNYHYLVEERLRQAGLNVEMVNLSVTGASPREQLELLDRYSARYAPDLVLHGFYAGNDFEILPGRQRHYRRILIQERSGLAALNPRNWTLLQALDGHARVAWNNWRLAKEPEAQKDGALFSPDMFLWLEWVVADKLYVRKPGRQVEWAPSLGYVAKIRSKAEEIGADYAMVFHPERMQVEDGLWQAVLKKYGLDPASLDRELPQRVLQRDCIKAGVPCLDLLPVFRSQDSSVNLYLAQDFHYSDVGNEIAADEIVKFLKGILPGGESP